MTASFSITRLVGDRALVKGHDAEGNRGSTVVHTEQWDSIKRFQRRQAAAVTADQALEDFLGPLNAALDKANAMLESDDVDPVTRVVFRPAVEGQPATSEDVAHLGRDSVILRLIEEGPADRLRWVNGELEILAHVPATVEAKVEEDVDALIESVTS